MVAAVALVGLDEMGRDDVAGGELGDGDVMVVGEREDAGASVEDPAPRWCIRPARRRVIRPAAVKPVVAQPVMPGMASVGGGDGFGGAR